MEHFWGYDWQGKSKLLVERPAPVLLPASHVTWNVLGSNAGSQDKQRSAAGAESDQMYLLYFLRACSLVPYIWPCGESSFLNIYSQNWLCSSPPFTEHKVSLPCSQKPATADCPEPTESSSQLNTFSFCSRFGEVAARSLALVAFPIFFVQVFV